MSPANVETPAGFAPAVAVAFGAGGAPATMVNASNPLPVTAAVGTASSTPLSGTISASGTVGPFAPQLSRPIWLTLSGSWAGSVQILRSTDGGATTLPLTYGDGTAKPALLSNFNAVAAEETVAAATYYLQFTRTSGTLQYRMEQ